MAKLKIVEHIPKPRMSEQKCQIQVKSKTYSRSFTIYGMDTDYLFEILFNTIKQIAESPINPIKIICYKPPEVDNNEATTDRRGYQDIKN